MTLADVSAATKSVLLSGRPARYPVPPRARTTRAAIPSPVRASCAATHSAASDPVPIRITSGWPPGIGAQPSAGDRGQGVPTASGKALEQGDDAAQGQEDQTAKLYGPIRPSAFQAEQSSVIRPVRHRVVPGVCSWWSLIADVAVTVAVRSASSIRLQRLNGQGLWAASRCPASARKTFPPPGRQRRPPGACTKWRSSAPGGANITCPARITQAPNGVHACLPSPAPLNSCWSISPRAFAG